MSASNTISYLVRRSVEVIVGSVPPGTPVWLEENGKPRWLICVSVNDPGPLTVVVERPVDAGWVHVELGHGMQSAMYIGPCLNGLAMPNYSVIWCRSLCCWLIICPTGDQSPQEGEHDRECDQPNVFVTPY